jgi:hypothetical protein
MPPAVDHGADGVGAMLAPLRAVGTSLSSRLPDQSAWSAVFHPPALCVCVLNPTCLSACSGT